MNISLRDMVDLAFSHFALDLSLIQHPKKSRVGEIPLGGFGVSYFFVMG